MNKIPISEARERLASVIEDAHRTAEPVYLTKRGRAVAVLLDAAVFARLTAAAEDAYDLAAVDLLRKEQASIPWAEIKAELGLS
ncbi:MAG: type II toxin-antitoxin system prevent-host-death family antitoxin [Actinomycetales bacterium]|nr:type II toxin-antitoxin system prevent-host-death family antitoxin [Actinomycetales bacterium]